MVDSIKPTYGSLSQKTNRYKTKRTSNASNIDAEEAGKVSVWDQTERRRLADRRKHTQKKDAKFEMRRNCGRRKTDRPFPNIEIEA